MEESHTDQSNTSNSTNNQRSDTSIDLNNPLHLQPSDAPGQSLVNAVFDGRGFPGWRRSIFIALSAKNKLGFINGNIPTPSLDASDYQQWTRCNNMVTSWILNSLSKDIGDSVMYSNTAAQLWKSLEHRFGQSNGAKLFHLQKEITSSVQGTQDIAGYFTKLKRLWDELDSLNSDIICTCVCICDGKKKLTKFLEDQRLMQFLMGLNETYSQARSSILMINPLPTLDHAYSLLLQDENQREVFTNAVNAQFPSETASFMVGKQGRTVQKPTRPFQRNAFPPQRFGNSGPQRAGNQFHKGKTRKVKYNPNVSCTYCLKTGHVREDCYKLIGYPDDFEFTNSREHQGNMKANAAMTGELNEKCNITQNEHSNIDGQQFMNGQQFTREQVSEIINIYRQMGQEATSGYRQMGQATTSGSGINANAVAGPFFEEGTSFW